MMLSTERKAESRPTWDDVLRALRMTSAERDVLRKNRQWPWSPLRGDCRPTSVPLARVTT